MPVGTLNSAEALALLYGVQAALEAGFYRVIVESDGSTTVNTALGKLPQTPYQGLFVADALAVSSYFQHVPRQANQLANALAHLLFSYRMSNYGWRIYPHQF